MIYIDLIYNLTLLVALSVISGFFADRLKSNSLFGNLVQGILFGGIALIGMLRPLNLGPGLIFDGRSVVLGLCAFFYGPLAGSIAAFMALILRILQGGVGATMGTLVILSATGIGIIFYLFHVRIGKRTSSQVLYTFGFLVHLVMVLLMFVLPPDVRDKTLKNVALPVLILYPLATVLIGKILEDNRTQRETLAELKKSEKEIKLSEKKLKTIFDTMPDFLWLKDKNGVFLACNKMFELTFGAKETDIIGKTDFDFVPVDIATRYRENDKKTLEADETLLFEEELRYVADGRRAFCETKKTPLVGPDGDVIGVLGIARDVSEQKEAERKIQELLVDKNNLLQEVHHRIKNNMNTIRGLLTLQVEAEENPVIHASLKDAESRIQTISILYDKLYCTDNYRELPVKSYIQPLVGDILTSFRTDKKITAQFDIENLVLNVQILSPLGILINEIVTNSMKYAFEGKEEGLISVSLSRKNNTIHLEVGDNGRGLISDAVRKDKQGFGLQLIAMICTQLKASITNRSENGMRYIIEFDI